MPFLHYYLKKKQINAKKPLKLVVYNKKSPEKVIKSIVYLPIINQFNSYYQGVFNIGHRFIIVYLWFLNK